MDLKIMKNINDVAEILIEYFNIQIPIENINELIYDLGGELNYCDFLEGFVDSELEKSGSEFKINVLNSLPEERKKMVIAYELGHLFLHMGYKLNDELWNNLEEKDFRKYYNSECVLQAYEFATALLMPNQYFLEAIYNFERNDKVDMKQIAEYFGVSIPAAHKRARSLDYIL